MNAMMHADNCTDSDLFDEGCWLALHASLLQDAEYVQMPTSDFAKHASVIVGHLAELQRLRKAADEVLKSYMPQFPDSRAVDDVLVGLAAARCSTSAAAGQQRT